MNEGTRRFWVPYFLMMCTAACMIIAVAVNSMFWMGLSGIFSLIFVVTLVVYWNRRT